MKNTTKDRLYMGLFALIGLLWLPAVVAGTLWVVWLFT